MGSPVWYLLNSAASGATELNSEGQYVVFTVLSLRWRAQLQSLYSVLHPTVVRQPKCQWVRSYLQAFMKKCCQIEGFFFSRNKLFVFLGGRKQFSAVGWRGPFLFTVLPLLLLFLFFSSAQTAFLWQSIVQTGTTHPLIFLFFIFPPSY